jgi:hypothetical protein
MKTEERAYPELVEATREAERAASERPTAPEVAAVDVEIPENWEELTNQVDGASGAGTGEARSERTRRLTVTSPIPAMMAESMRKDKETTPPARDPAAPQEGEPESESEFTRRLGDSSDGQHVADDDGADGYTVELVNDGNAERRQRAARLIDRARASMEAGDIGGAALAAEEALEEADQAAPPGIVEVIEPARPLLGRIFAAFVGPLSEVPVMARRNDEIAGLGLDEHKRAVLARVDGATSLEQIFDAARIPAGDALRIAASLLRDGIVRVV